MVSYNVRDPRGHAQAMRSGSELGQPIGATCADKRLCLQFYIDGRVSSATLEGLNDQVQLERVLREGSLVSGRRRTVNVECVTRLVVNRHSIYTRRSR